MALLVVSHDREKNFSITSWIVMEDKSILE